MKQKDFDDVEKIISNFFVEREGEGILEIIRDINLFEEGYLDSLDYITLASHIEENFNIKIDLTDQKTFDSLNRFDGIVSLVKNK